MANPAEIKQHMTVVGSDDDMVGTVDHVGEQNMIKLAKDDRGEHHWIPVAWVTGVDAAVHLGVPARQAQQYWGGADTGTQQNTPAAGQSAADPGRRDAPAAEAAHGTPQPMEDGRGATILGPRNVPLERQNPDLLTPPRTDNGTVPNLWFPFSAAHMRLEEGGWAREVTVRELPIATTLAGVNMRLTPGGVRELHWHKQSEWAYMLDGRARITAVDQDGRNFVDDVGVGDLWFFPPGIPHSIQGLEEGCEFLLVFDDGNFSENSTFLLSDWFAHTPREVLAKNFGVSESDFADIPSHELYIFQGQVPGPLASDQVSAPNGTVPRRFSHHLLAQEPIQTLGGTVRIADSSNFPASTTTAAALVEVEPGAMRELHWHPNTDEWQYYIAGQGRMTVFASGGKARTFDYRAGDVGYVPFAMGHYVENTGGETLRFLEMFKSDHFADMSLDQWLALTPPELVRSHLRLNQTVMDALHKEKEPVVSGSGS